MPRKIDIDKSALTIGVDGKRAVLNNTGLGNYSRYYLNIMSMAYPSTKFRVYTPRIEENERLRPLLTRPNIELFAPSLATAIQRSWWRTIDLPIQLNKDQVSLYHGLSNELPLTGVLKSIK